MNRSAVLASVLAISWAFSTLVFGAWSDRIGRKKILDPSNIRVFVALLGHGRSRDYHELLLVRALMGIAEGPTWSIITALIEESSSKSRRGRNIGIVVSAAALVGLAAAPVLTTQVAARFGWRWAFFVAGAPGLISGILIWRYVKEPQSESRGEVHGHKIGFGDYLSILSIATCGCAASARPVSWAGFF